MVRSDYREFTDGLKLVAITFISAALTATVVIGTGHAVLNRSLQPAATDTARAGDLIRTSVR